MVTYLSILHGPNCLTSLSLLPLLGHACIVQVLANRIPELNA